MSFFLHRTYSLCLLYYYSSETTEKSVIIEMCFIEKSMEKYSLRRTTLLRQTTCDQWDNTAVTGLFNLPQFVHTRSELALKLLFNSVSERQSKTFVVCHT